MIRLSTPSTFVWASIALCSIARADEGVPASSFPRGTFSLSLEADYAHSFDLSRARIESGTVGVGYYLFDNIALDAEVAGFAVQQAGPESTISEMDFRIRHHLINSGKFSFFLDFGAGVSYANTRTPATGTQFNYVLQPGLGATWELRDHVYLMAGARYWHLSNARLEGPLRNPSINANEGYVGVLVTF